MKWRTVYRKFSVEELQLNEFKGEKLSDKNRGHEGKCIRQKSLRLILVKANYLFP
jgi:hypothetical protein